MVAARSRISHECGQGQNTLLIHDDDSTMHMMPPLYKISHYAAMRALMAVIVTLMSVMGIKECHNRLTIRQVTFRMCTECSATEAELVMGLGNLPAVQICTTNTVWSCFRGIQKQNLLFFRGRKLHSYLSIHWVSRVQCDL